MEGCPPPGPGGTTLNLPRGEYPGPQKGIFSSSGASVRNFGHFWRISAQWCSKWHSWLILGPKSPALPASAQADNRSPGLRHCARGRCAPPPQNWGRVGGLTPPSPEHRTQFQRSQPASFFSRAADPPHRESVRKLLSSSPFTSSLFFGCGELLEHGLSAAALGGFFGGLDFLAQQSSPPTSPLQGRGRRRTGPAWQSLCW